MTSLKSNTQNLTLLLLLFPFLLASINAWGNSCDFLEYNGGDDWYPFFFREDDGSLGIANDVLKKASLNINQSLELSASMPWKRQLLELKFGHLDIIAGVTKTPENEEHFLFSFPVTHANLTVFSRHDANLNIKTLSDLKNLRGVKLLGMSLGEELNKFVLEELIVDETRSLESVFKMTQYGRVDYAIAYEKAGLRYVDKLGLSPVIKSHNISLSSDSIHIMVAKNNACLENMNAIFKQIELLKGTQELNTIIEKYSTQSSLVNGV